MGIFDKAASKLKNMFIEEIPEDLQTIKKEVIKVPIPAPEEEISKEAEKVSVAETKEEKFVFPVFMDEDEEIDPKKELEKNLTEKKETKFRDFGSEYESENRTISKREADLIAAFNGPKPTQKRETRVQDEVVPVAAKKSSYREEIESKLESYTRSYGEKKEVVVPIKKQFIPTPVISPVYGILDENYSKDDITVKEEKKKFKLTSTLESDVLTIDDVRLKAFGTLEDEIDSSLFEDDGIFIEDELDINLEDNLLNDELDKLSDDELDIELSVEKPVRSRRKTKIEPEADNMIEEVLSRSYDIEEDNDREESTEDDDNLYMSENDLFNLIDSMYEKRDEE